MLLQSIVNGLALGSIYALVALGFVLLWKSAEVLNFAQGEFMMLGAYMAYTFTVIFGLPVWISFLLAILSMAFFGMLLERIFMRPLMGEPVFSIAILTVGISIIIRTLAGMIWGFDAVKLPLYASEKPLSFMGLVLAQSHLMIIITTILIIIALGVFLKYFKLGIAMKAVGLNQLASLYLGVNIKRFLSLNWVLASVFGCIAGILISPIIYLNPDLGIVGIKALPAAILGGFRSILGAIIGGVIIGLAENVASGYLPTWIKDIVPWCILFVILIIRPYGIFGSEEVKRV
jgi:branched-chain amino acid transport system permease protein